MDAFELFTTPLTETCLIEASAGTGKTYTVTGLYLRLLLEAQRRVDQILVVTFTNAATEELKTRIRARLIGAQQAFLRNDGDDPVYQALLARIAGDEERALALRRLANAIRGFDEAAIFTIHSFCQRVLADQAFASGMPFESELRRDLRELLTEIVEDFWRQRFYDSPPLLVHYLLDQRRSPARLLQEIQAYLGKPYLRVLGADGAVAWAAETRFARAYRRVQSHWRTCRETVANLLLESQALNKAHYKAASIPGWVSAMDDYLISATPRPGLFDKFDRFSTARLQKSTRRNESPPRHPFFDDCEALLQVHAQLCQAYETGLKALRVELLHFCNDELDKRKRRLQLQSYDDLLSNLNLALQSPRGEALASGIRKRYTAALIDEFQDTDPVQYDIFRRLYATAELPIFFVGDPKQAIYSFRGADIFAYLSARDTAVRRHTLDRNWRSEPGLIDAVNRLFGNAPQPFLFRDIPYHQVRAADKPHPVLRVEGRSPPLQIWFVGGDQDDKALAKTEAGKRIAAATAAEIARLLTLAQSGRASIDERALSGGDIAVLVRTHYQGRLIRRQLLRLGIPSVQHAQDNVFHSPEAEDLERVLAALAEPGREASIRAALATRLLGHSAAAIHALNQDEAAWEDILDRFHDYHECWREQGFMALFRSLMRREGIAARLLAHHDGERQLTNLLHLAELLQQAASRQRLGVEALSLWLAQRRLAESSADEEHEYTLRLESDENLVQIVTVHKSKGLEYPIVFCPFLWDGRLASDKAEVLSFHDPEDGYRAVLDLGTEDQDRRRRHARDEDLAENLRLLYVALTRAAQRCYLVWGHLREAGHSPLAWLLHRAPQAGGKDPVTATAERYNAMSASALRHELETLARGSDAIGIAELPEEATAAYSAPASDDVQRRARRFAGLTPEAWRIASFTALTAQHGAELPDYDASAWAEPQLAEKTSERSIFTFPRGARAGRCLHQIFENWDFTSRDRAALDYLVIQTLDEHGFAPAWSDVVADTVERVLAQPLAADCPPLATVGLQHRVDELEFYYPLTGLRAEDLKRLLADEGAGPGAFQEDLETLSFAPAKGYMKGFIDLVFQAEGKFYLVDYKSNWLGPATQDYTPERLADAMARDAYYLQYLIYTVALHRYLKLRLPGYAYQRHFGGVFYLFLRGMDPAHGDCGIFRDRPTAALIEKLDAYLAGGRKI